MTSFFLMIAPTDPLCIPPTERRQAVVATLRRLRPHTRAWSVRIASEPVAHVGVNFEMVFCPQCEADVYDFWPQAMNRWQARADRRNLSTALPCCGLRASLNDLDYITPQAFACFAVEMERGGPDLEPHERRQVEAALGVPVRTFWKVL